MELKEGIYSIPPGHTLKILGDRQIQISPYKNGVSQSLQRCRDCEHLKIGRKCMDKQWWDSTYCEMKPKGKKKQLFYSAKPSDKACTNNFKPKNNG